MMLNKWWSLLWVFKVNEFSVWILSADASFLAYRPSCIAAAAILSAANEIPNWSFVNPEHAESWCEGLSKVSILYV